jgi:hypothetical protein
VQSFSGSTAISSDMVYGNAASAHSHSEPEDPLARLKDSVKDFFNV